MSTYVYVYSEGHPIYVGIGTEDGGKFQRARDIAGHFEIRNKKPKIRIVARNLPRPEALRLEALLIAEYRQHFPLVNKQIRHEAEHAGTEVAHRTPRRVSISSEYSIFFYKGIWELIFQPRLPEATIRLCTKYWARIWPEAVNLDKYLVWEHRGDGDAFDVLIYSNGVFRYYTNLGSRFSPSEIEAVMKCRFYTITEHLRSTFVAKCDTPEVRRVQKVLSREGKLHTLLRRIEPMNVALNRSNVTSDSFDPHNPPPLNPVSGYTKEFFFLCF